MPRIRAPGAGRKPKGPIQGKSAAFSTRITAETRGALEAEAAHSGQSVSQVAERLLKIGLEATRERDADDPMRALCYLMEGVAQGCVFIREDDKLCDWRNDPYTFDAFRAAVNMLFDRRRPAGDFITPKEFDALPTSRTIEQHGELAFAPIWRTVQRSRPRSPSDIEASMREAGARPWPAVAIGSLSRVSYAVEDARRALHIDNPIQSPTTKSGSEK